jgi:hypothetical protein
VGRFEALLRTGASPAPEENGEGWVVEGFDIGIPSGYHYRIQRTDAPVSFRRAAPPDQP